jgi:hypothetical protein
MGIRHTLPKGRHRLLAMSNEGGGRLRAWWSTDAVDIVPNARDVFAYHKIPASVQRFAEQTGLLQADLRIVYPFSMPRYEAKGVPVLLSLMQHIVKNKMASKLVLVHPHTMRPQDKQALDDLKEAATDIGLSKHAVLWTGDHFPAGMGPGLTEDEMRGLFLLSTVFVCPSKTEHYSLSALEAALTVPTLVLNQDLSSLYDMMQCGESQDVLWHSFGTLAKPGKVDDTSLEALALRIVATTNEHPVRMRHAWHHSGLRIGGRLETTLDAIV